MNKKYLLTRAPNEDWNQTAYPRISAQFNQSLRRPHEKEIVYLAIRTAFSENSD